MLRRQSGPSFGFNHTATAQVSKQTLPGCDMACCGGVAIRLIGPKSSLCQCSRLQVSKRVLPGCNKVCCGGVVPGGFVKDMADPAAMHYRAANSAGCQYVDYRRHEVCSRRRCSDLERLHIHILISKLHCWMVH